MACATEYDTGVRPLIVGSIEPFQAQPYYGDLPWDITGGSALLHIKDPTGAVQTYTATILTGGSVRYPWTVANPVGDWTRAWDLTDAQGRHQITPPIFFTVATSP